MVFLHYGILVVFLSCFKSVLKQGWVCMNETLK